MIITSEFHLARIERNRTKEIKKFWEGKKPENLDDGKNRKLTDL